jgi:exodeoxyribonuclease V alpha subunit
MIHQGLSEKGFDVAVAAPTGKAAKRITEATGLPAVTLHRLLAYTNPGELDANGKPCGSSFPRRNRASPLAYNAVLCDEYAMVNQEVHKALVEAMPARSILRVFGDANQLAPIEEEGTKDGLSVFLKLLAQFNGIRLDTIHRQGEGSGIATNGKRILQGITPMRFDDFHMTVTPDIIAGLIGRVREMEKDRVFFNNFDNQIITPTYKTTLGSRALNQVLQSHFLDLDARMDQLDFLDVPRWGEKTPPQRMFVGDKVICTKNNYDLDIFNGETGIITALDMEYGVMTIDFGDKTVEVPPTQPFFGFNGKMMHFDPRRNIDLAYCVTTHKAQGSEYKNVLYVFGHASGRLRSRRNFYTAVTRARHSCSIVADMDSIKYALWNQKEGFN